MGLRAPLVLVLLLVLGLVLGACGTPAKSERPPVAVTPIVANQPKPENPNDLSFELQNVTIVRAAELFTARTGHEMAVHARALPMATCRRITVRLGEVYRLDATLDAFDAALSDAGLALARYDDRYLVIVGQRDADRVECGIDPEQLAKWILSGVHKVDDTRYEISHASVDLVLDRIIELVPSKGPAARGKRGVSIDDRWSTDLVAGVGAKRGDLIVAVQGEPIRSGRDAAKVLDALRDATEIVVDLERDGRKMQLRYRVVP